ncbi:Uncharacterized protein OBRU01_09842, partial [Operophtera brumata]
LLNAKKGLEGHYTAKYQELREASQKMEDDMNHRLKLKDMTIEELDLKIQHAVQSKAFFKEQWGRAVRELHLVKLSTRKQMLTQLKLDRRQLGDMGLDTIEDATECDTDPSPLDMKKLKDDFYVDILANTPPLDSHSIITQRDRLIQQDSPNEDTVKQLNHEIRNMLLNCGT